MAFYKYGLAFLAGTGFGAAVTTLRRDRCQLRRHRCRDVATAALPEAGKREKHYLQEEGKKGTRCPKKGGSKEKKGETSSYNKEG